MWEIKETGYNKDNIIHYGNKFLTGHIKLGIRGTLDEYSKTELVACNLPLIYDQVGTSWRESVNAYNPLYTELLVNGNKLSVLEQEPIYHEQAINLKDASMRRLTKWIVDNIEVTLESVRFVSLEYSRMIFGFYKVHISENAIVEIRTGIDLDVWDINGPHLTKQNLNNYNNKLIVESFTQELAKKITVYKHLELKCKYFETNTINDNDKYLLSYKIEGKKNETISFEHTSYIGVDEELDDIKRLVEEASRSGYSNNLQIHQKIWEDKWNDSDVEIKGDESAQIALRYSIYHLLLLSPSIYSNSSIPARGISGQTYKGAIFWDTEIFMLPFYLNTDRYSAKTIIDYRINTLNGARLKAKEYGFKGAFYAWESQEDGYDACTDYNVTDVFTDRLVRTYFKDKQVHISADIVYAINSYINHTNDYSILKAGALEVILEVARFFLDYGNYKLLSDSFEIWDVMGPDEYHERVNNNAFTNKMVALVFKLVIDLEKYYKYKNDEYFKNLAEKLNYEKELQIIKEIVHKIYENKFNKDGVIEQFDGYFKLKDIEKAELLKQKMHPNEYLGGNGLAGDTQIIKQADVITMLYLFRESFSKETMKINWDYYEKRTEHGSSLSASMYALIACLTDNSEYAYPLFMKSASIDLTGESKQYAGGIYIGGSHPAASGGAYITAIYGFAGLTFNGDKLSLIPKLPKSIESISFKIKKDNKQYKIYVSRNNNIIEELNK